MMLHHDGSATTAGGRAARAAVLAAALAMAGAAHADVTVDTAIDADVDDAACSLREAIVAVNTNASYHGCVRTNAAVDRIEFDLGSGTPVITLGTLLPALSGPTVVDGGTGGATRVAVMSGGGLATGLSFLGAADASGSQVRNLVLGGFTSRQLLISNGNGIVVEGCLIGTDPTGAAVAANSGSGIELCAGFGCGTTNTTRIGGPSAAHRNVIVAGTSVAISVGPSAGTTIQGNLINTNASGTARLGGNTAFGITINNASGTVIGGANPGEGNVIAGFQGIRIGGNPALSQSSGTVIQGNFIGTDVTGTVDLGAGSDGIAVAHAVNTLIGGTEPGAGNLISGNQDGIAGGSSGVSGTSVDDTTVQGNFIGTTASGATPLPNTGVGINLGDDAVIEGNLIAFNGGDGVQVICTACTQRVSGNAIHSNGGLGIDLSTSGVTANDPDDVDTGSNGRQNFPILDAVVFPGGDTVSGTLDSTPGTIFRVEIFANDACDPSGNGEGQEPVGAVDDVTTDANGDASFVVTLDADVPAGKIMTATAIAPDGSTSEFSPCTPAEPTTTSTTTSTSSSTTTSTSTSSTSSTSTSSSSTGVPTTSTSSTAPPTTSSSSTAPPTTSTVATTSSTSSTAVATTSTSTSSSTNLPTTTTAPPVACDGVPAGPTFGSIVCRLDALLARIDGEAALGTFGPRLALSIARATARTLDAENECRVSSTRKAKRRLFLASQSLALYAQRLSSLSARNRLEAALRQSFLEAGRTIQRDVKTLRGALRCPDDAPLA